MIKKSTALCLHKRKLYLLFPFGFAGDLLRLIVQAANNGVDCSCGINAVERKETNVALLDQLKQSSKML